VTPSPALANALHHVRFWTDFYDLTSPVPGTYEPLDDARATFRAGGHALVLRFHPLSPHEAGPMGRFSLELDGTPIAFEDRAERPSRGPSHRHALRWAELEAIARGAAMRDREPHPGTAVALLARFTPICVGDDADRAHAMIDAALRRWSVPELAIERMIASIDRRPSSLRWDRGTNWALIQKGSVQNLGGQDLGDEGTWRLGGEFPDDELQALVVAASDDAETVAKPLRTPRTLMLARGLADGDAQVAPILADWLRQSGCDHTALLAAFAEPFEPAAVAWAGEVLADVPPGSIAVPETRFEPLPRYLRLQIFGAAGPAIRAAIVGAGIGTFSGRLEHDLETAGRPDLPAVATRVLAMARDGGAAQCRVSWFREGRWHHRDL
jgi:hypothetical protein